MTTPQSLWRTRTLPAVAALASFLTFFAINAHAQAPSPSPTGSPQPAPVCPATEGNPGLGRDPGAPPLTMGPYIRGDANGDGKVNANDTQAVQNYLNGNKAALSTFDRADVNADNKLNSSDVSYLQQFLNQGTLPPREPYPLAAVSHPMLCWQSPCYAILNGKRMRYVADKTLSWPDRAIWNAAVYDPVDNKVAVKYTIELNYGLRDTSIKVDYGRPKVMVGNSIIPDISAETIVVPTKYNYINNKKVREEVGVRDIVMGLAELLTVDTQPPEEVTVSPRDAYGIFARKPGDGNQKYPRNADGCSGPMNNPLELVGKEPPPGFTECCIAHDYCYQRGGNKESKKFCDDQLEECIKPLTPPHPWYNWALVPIGCGPAFQPISNYLQGLFSGSAFRWHAEGCTCMVDSSGDPAVDAQYDHSAVWCPCSNNNCPTCEGGCEALVRMPGETNARKVPFPCGRTLLPGGLPCPPWVNEPNPLCSPPPPNPTP